MKIWSFPGIYPYPEGNDLTTGIFNHKQSVALKNIGVNVEVVQPWNVAPIWPINQLFPDWKKYASNTRPDVRTLDGIKINHPKIFTPKPSRVFKKPYEYYLLNKLEQFFKAKGVNPEKDLIHAQWLIPDGRIAVLLAKRLNLKCVVELNGDDVIVWPHKSEIHKNHALFVLENADYIIGCSQYLCDQAEILFGKKLFSKAIYKGVNTSHFIPFQESTELIKVRAKYNLHTNDFVILNVGSPIQRKGWLELFQAVSMLKVDFPQIKILAASGGIQDFKLIDKAREYGVEDNLVDLGQVKNENLLELYQLCDVFALPSYWEGLANVLCEAMSCGCAVVTTAVAGHPEVIENGVNGFLIAPKDVNALKKSLQNLIENPKLKQDFGQNARQTALNKIQSHEANAQKLQKLFQGVLTEHI
ncbi:MAG: glycosyltransferase family 4 protein [Cytophagales bacterium]